MKKRLVLVGNREDRVDRSEFVNSADFVCRVNRMNSFGLTGTKTDLLLVDTHDDFFKLYDREKYLDIVHKYVKKIVVVEDNSNQKGPDLFDPDLIRTRETLTIDSVVSAFDSRLLDSGHKPTNAFVFLLYLLENRYHDKYDIFITNESRDRRTGDEHHDGIANLVEKWYSILESNRIIQFI